MLNQNYDWAFNIAYNSILQAVRALMLAKATGLQAEIPI